MQHIDLNVMSSQFHRIRTNPRFAELAVRRSRFALLLSAVVLTSYYGLMMLVAFAPEVLRTPISEGAILTVGVPIGATIIVGSWLLTGWFLHRANGKFDQMNQAIIQEGSK
jgi:uncharacterized membrane protein (DUF485 family)